MSQQVTDPFLWEKEEWIFLRADDVYSLFDPKEYGFEPTAPTTACWKGFKVRFRVTDKQLFLDGLEIYCEDGNYPPINDVKPVPGQMHMQAYHKLDIMLQYSGTIIIGRSMKPEFRGRAFTGPHSYFSTVELVFESGKLVSHKDTSGQYFGI